MTPTNDIKRIAETLYPQDEIFSDDDGHVYRNRASNFKLWSHPVKVNGKDKAANFQFTLSDPAIQLEMQHYLEHIGWAFYFSGLGDCFVAVLELDAGAYEIKNEDPAERTTLAFLKQLDGE